MGAIAERSRLQRLGRRNPQQLHHKRAVQRASGSEFPAESDFPADCESAGKPSDWAIITVLQWHLQFL